MTPLYPAWRSIETRPTHTLKMTRTTKASAAYRQDRGQCPRRIPTAKIHGARKCDRYVADAVPLTIGVCGQADNPKGHCGERDRHPIHRVPRPRRTIYGAPLTSIMLPYCSTGLQYGRTAERSATSDPYLTPARCGPPKRLYQTKTADASRASGKSNFKICMTLPHPCDRLDGNVPHAKVKSRTEPST